ncbi:gamma-glutamylcyclotransferase family protein [Simiduia agarivorans]|uniref:Gamma-glutamylcyclotransferase AIG2-like domain-containing protein n=1 Tax=Simiduia agarivorans (strain DSM 21679 / JCM 13881 / BCRC 17597 / SA1) TaxID=1117647 RepID=K4KE34_SIMAS|nr:gamma-glutamylcyclotransferase family protein [Simiduia agarivorans]AFU97294.1 hypothetical protein M5M_00285 [Simiduia agarivorans SA1 = DSM 21679]
MPHATNTRLFTYGTLAPGRKNHHLLQALAGHWQTGTVKGQLIEAGWASADGYPAMRPDSQGIPIHGFLLHSLELPDLWASLDAFEGNDYQRIPIEVECENGDVVMAFIYALAPDK